MTITREKVIEFFEDKCSQGEAEAIYEYLQEHPEWMEEYFAEDEWRDTASGLPLPDDQRVRIWDRVNKRKTATVRDIRSIGEERESLNGEEATVVRRRWRYAGVAVAAMIVAGTGVFFAWRAGFPSGAAPVIAKSGQSNNHFILINNRTRWVYRDTLDDGSVLELSPGSSLRFMAGFEAGKRDVTLKGEALFKVAHDPKRPFTVFAEGLATTALGTIFRVSAYEGRGVASVHLLQGSVIVKCVARPELAAMLSPGEGCTFDLAGNTLKKSRAVPEAARKMPDLSNMDDGSFEETAEAIAFKNMPLPRVLHILSLTYHTPILYRGSELNKRKYTGNIDKQVSLELALNNLADLNDLVVGQQTGGGFRVHLHQ